MEFKENVFYLHSKRDCGQCSGYKRRIMEYSNMHHTFDWQEIMYEKDEHPSEIINQLPKNKGFMGFPFITIVIKDRHYKIYPSEIPNWCRRFDHKRKDLRFSATATIQDNTDIEDKCTDCD